MRASSKIPCKEASYKNVLADQMRSDRTLVGVEARVERGRWTEVVTGVKARTGEGREGQRRVESGEWNLPLM